MMKKLALFLLAAAWAVAGFAQDRLYADEFPLGDVKLLDGLDGHVGGHYLAAMAMNAATGKEECRRRMEYMLAELQECADANVKNHPEWGKGYVGGMPLLSLLFNWPMNLKD